MDALECITTRRSIRRFTQEPVARESLEQIVNAGRLAASAGNMQAASFIVIEKGEIIKGVMPALGWLKGPGGPTEDAEPTACIVILGDPSIFKYYQSDCAAAAQNIQLSAWALGIGSCWIGALKKDLLGEAVPLPEGKEFYACIVLGFPAEESSLCKNPGIEVKRREDGTVCVQKRNPEEIITFL